MKRKSSGIRWAGIVLSVMLVALAMSAVYYYFHVSAQRTYHTARNFRLLGLIGDQLKGKIENYNEVLQYQARNLQTIHEFNAKMGLVPHVELQTPFSPEDESRKINGVNARMDVRHIQGFYWLYIQCEFAQSPGDPFTEEFRVPFSDVIQQDLAQNAFDDILVVQSDGSVVFQGNSSGPAIMTLGSLLPKDTSQKEQKQPSSSGSTFVQDPETKRQQESAEPAVAVKSSPAGTRNRRGLSGIKAPRPETLASKRAQPPSNRTLPVGSGPDLASGVQDVSVADGDYKLFVQPVRVFLNDLRGERAGREQWYVCGLVQSTKFLMGTLVVSYSVRVLIVFLLLLGLLFIPLLRVGSIGLADRLHRLDIVVLFAAVLISSAVITLFCLGVIRSSAATDDTDKQLEKLSTQIADNFNAELLAVSAQLQQANEEFRSKCPACLEWLKIKPSQNQRETKSQTAGSSKVAGVLSAGPPCEPQRLNILNEQMGPYPFFEMVVWVGPDGQQQVKWTTRKAATQFNPVGDRSYFTEVRGNRLWSIKSKDKESRAFALERIVSRNTGEKPTVLAMEGPEEGSVATIDFYPLSLVDTVLPPGFGYCVMDEEGKEMYHSDDFRVLRENFFEECDNDQELRSVVFARIARPVKTRYLGSDRQMYVRPLAAPPWTLIVFRDTPVLETVSLEVLTIVTLLSFFNAIPVLLVFRLIYSEGWIWPAPGKARRYSSLVALNLLLCALFGLAILVFNDPVILAGLAIVFPPLALVVTYLVLTRKSVASRLDKIARLFKANSWLRYRVGFTLNTVSLTLLLSVLPSIALFWVAHDFEARLFLKLNQLKLARAMETRDRKVKEKYRDIEVSGVEAPGGLAPRDVLLDSRLSFSNCGTQGGRRYSDVYIKFFLDEDPSWSSPPAQDAIPSDARAESERSAGATAVLLQSKSLAVLLESIIDSVMQLRPIYNQTCIEMHELTRAESGDGLWRSEESQGKLSLYKRPVVSPVRPPTQDVLTINAILPVQHRLTGLAIPLLLILPLYYLIKFLYGRVFFLNVDPGETPLVPELSARTISQNVVVVGTRFAGIDKRFRCEAFNTIDLRSGVRQYGSFDKYDCAGLVDKIVVIRHLEDDHHDYTLTDEKLNLLERVLGYARVVIVATTVDPSNFQFSGSSKDGTTPNDGAREAEEAESSPQAERCKRLLSSFVWVYLDDKAGANCSSAASRKLTSSSSWLGRLVKRFPARADEAAGVAAAVKQVEIEMAQSSHLEHIGRRLLSDHDSLTREKVIKSFLLQARPYYDGLWATCSRKDRLALFHLAQDHMVTCGDAQLQRLLARGLVVLRPNLRLMNASFARYVVSVCRPEDVRQWRLLGERSTWSKLRIPLLTGLVAVAVFVLVTQREVYDYTLTAVSTLTVGVPALFKVVGLVRGGFIGFKGN